CLAGVCADPPARSSEAEVASPQIPIPCTGSRCGVPVTCNLPQSPGTACTNRIDLFVRRAALRRGDGAPDKPPRRIRFALVGIASIPPGETANVRIRLTERGRRIASMGPRRLGGVIAIRNAAGTATSCTPVTIRIMRR
ncbi:MAG: hypothetical protein ACREV8_00705, partial [Gammaproteobacteria bacterium]